jgi:hypothetical protein
MTIKITVGYSDEGYFNNVWVDEFYFLAVPRVGEIVTVPYGKGDYRIRVRLVEHMGRSAEGSPLIRVSGSLEEE